MNKSYITSLLLFSLSALSAQSLQVEYEVQFKLMNTQHIRGNDDFKNKVKEAQNQPQKHILKYSDGNAVYESFPPSIVYDSSIENNDASKISTNSYQIAPIKLFKLKDKEGFYSYKKVKSEEFYQYAIAKFDEIRMLPDTEVVLNYPCKITEVQLPENRKAKVWYTEDIPVKIGPMSYYNFPGLVLRVETDFMSIQVKNIDKTLASTNLEKMDENLKVDEIEKQ